jgi:hypothetical protein
MILFKFNVQGPTNFALASRRYIIEEELCGLYSGSGRVISETSLGIEFGGLDTDGSIGND